jgi:hypothetical protein
MPSGFSVTPIGPTEKCEGGSIDFSVSAPSGTGPFTYKWQKDGSGNLGSSTAYSISSLATGDAGSYTCVVSNICSTGTTSNASVLTVNTKPTVTVSANPTTICSGSSTTVSANPTGGSGSYPGYAWSPLGSGQSFSDNPVATTSYTVTVTDSKGCTATGSGAVTVNANISVVSIAPTGDQSFSVGGSGTQLTVSETGGGTITGRQWKYSTAPGGPYGNNISGATGSAYTPQSSDLGGGGTYYVVCTSTPTCGSAMTSNEVKVTVTSGGCTSLVSVIAGVSSSPACEGSSETFTANISPSNATSPTYQWKKDDTNISGATNQTYVINSVVSNDEADYICVVSQACSGISVTSSAVTLTIKANANIVVQPGDRSMVKTTGTTYFKVISSGVGLSYIWQYSINNISWSSISDGTPAGAVYSNQTTSNMTVGNISATGTYYYRCIVSSSCSASITSSSATLSVNDSGIAGLWDGDESTVWTNPLNWNDNTTVPGSGTAVIIPGSTPFQPIISSGVLASCNTITIKPGATLTIDAGGTLTSYGTAANNITVNPTGGITVNGTVTGNMILQSSAAGTAGLIQGSNSNIPGYVTIQRYIPGIGYHYIASPSASVTVGSNQIIGFTPSDISPAIGDMKYYTPENPPSPFPNMWRIDEAHSHELIPEDQNAWVAPRVNEPMAAMWGYAINLAAVPSQPLYVRVIGNSLNKGNIDYSVSKQAESTDTYHDGKIVDGYGNTLGKNTDGRHPVNILVNDKTTNGWHLVGNPYPSPINWDVAANDADNMATTVSNTIAYFKPTGRWTGIYGAYQAGGTISGAVLSPVQSKYIPVMCSFMINNNDINIGHPEKSRLYFKDLHRTLDPVALNSYFYKKANTEIPLIRLAGYISGKKEFRDEAVVYFDRNAKEGYNIKYDSPKLMNTDVNYPNIYTISREKNAGIIDNNFSIKALPLSLLDNNGSDFNNVIIPLGFDVNAPGNYTIDVSLSSQFSNLSSQTGTHVYLVDMKEGVSQDLTINPEYKFTINDQLSTINESRFYLKFTNNEQRTTNNEFCNIYTSGNILYVNYYNPINYQLSTINDNAVLSIYNISGQNLKEFNIQNSSFNIPLDVVPGVYFVRVVTSSRVYVEKIIVHSL